MALMRRHISCAAPKVVMIGKSQGIQQAIRLASKAAKSPDTTVLIEGETGTGKELIAKIIHEYSSRAGKPYVCINCGAITKELVESELFGYEKGTFTGGLHDGKKGKFEIAHGGSILLDEISEIIPTTQVKLLRVIEEREFYPVGGTVGKKVDVRIIAATNRSLEVGIQEGSFRKDLYFRLNVVKIQLPALRDRKLDIIPLASFFMNTFNNKFGKAFNGISNGAEDILVRYPWPGNVRELRNVIERIMLLEDGKVIQPCHLDFLSLQSSTVCQPAYIEKEFHIPDLKKHTFAYSKQKPDAGVEISTPGITLDEMNKQVIIHALQLAGGNRSKAARMLGISRATAVYRINKYTNTV